jgi:hypothetical protein
VSYGAGVPLDELPSIDEHCVRVTAPPDVVWDAALRRFSSPSPSRLTGWLARALGADPGVSSGSRPAAVDSTVPGFRVVTADRPHLLVVAGRHRFARYAIVFRIERSADGTRCRAESRAEFPGLHGRLYRLAVIGSRGHVVAVRRLLDGIRRSTERTAGTSRT